jgi:predicted CopG family antitoxin
MISTMTPSERRRAYKLKRIVISEHNYLALKKLGQAGDSFNDVINNLLRIETNHQQANEKKRQEQQQLHQQQKSGYDAKSSISNVTNELYSPSFIDEAMAMEQHKQQMDELFRTVEEAQQRKQRQEHNQTNEQENGRIL